MKTPTNALTLLQAQHAEVDRLFEKIEQEKDPNWKASFFEELADKLAAHAKIEEQLFYPMVMSNQTKDILLESAEEHLAIKRVLADLLELDPSDPSFDAKLSVMKEEVNHHAHEEEEGKLFPMVSKIVTQDELEACGSEMLRVFLELLETDPHTEVPNETDHAASVMPTYETPEPLRADPR